MTNDETKLIDKLIYADNKLCTIKEKNNKLWFFSLVNNKWIPIRPVSKLEIDEQLKFTSNPQNLDVCFATCSDMLRNLNAYSSLIISGS